MEPNEIIDITREGIYVLMMISAPPIIAALLVGLLIALFQALTQIQEATLTFVPKIIAMLITLSLTLPFMFDTLAEFAHKLQDKIVHIQ